MLTDYSICTFNLFTLTEAGQVHCQQLIQKVSHRSSHVFNHSCNYPVVLRGFTQTAWILLLLTADLLTVLWTCLLRQTDEGVCMQRSLAVW